MRLTLYDFQFNLNGVGNLTYVASYVNLYNSGVHEVHRSLGVVWRL